jgi:hypothetical protein
MPDAVSQRPRLRPVAIALLAVVVIALAVHWYAYKRSIRSVSAVPEGGTINFGCAANETVEVLSASYATHVGRFIDLTSQLSKDPKVLMGAPYYVEGALLHVPGGGTLSVRWRCRAARAAKDSFRAGGPRAHEHAGMTVTPTAHAPVPAPAPADAGSAAVSDLAAHRRDRRTFLENLGASYEQIADAVDGTSALARVTGRAAPHPGLRAHRASHAELSDAVDADFGETSNGSIRDIITSNRREFASALLGSRAGLGSSRLDAKFESTETWNRAPVVPGGDAAVADGVYAGGPSRGALSPSHWRGPALGEAVAGYVAPEAIFS